MNFREADISDIKQIQLVRHSVKENVLSNHALVTDDDCKEFLFNRGKGWICEIDNRIVGFAIADLRENNIWALFVHPEFEGKGIGSKLHKVMLDWYFDQHKKMLGWEHHLEQKQKNFTGSKDGPKLACTEKMKSNLK